jgi:hypothetical protein
MQLALTLALGLGGASNNLSPGSFGSVWMWEAGQGLLWESGSFMLTE